VNPVESFCYSTGGYIVHGIVRRRSSFNTGRIDHLFNDPEVYGKKLFLHYGDLTDSSNLDRLLEKTEPDEIKWDSSKPYGTPQKLLNVEKLHKLRWENKIELDEGIKRDYDWYKK